MAENFLQQVVLSNKIEQWLIALGIIVFMVLFAHGISRLVAWFSVKYLTKVDHANFKETINDRLVRPLSRFLFWLIAVIALNNLVFPKVLDFMVFKMPFSHLVQKLALSFVIFLFFNMLIGVVYMIATVFKRSATRKADRSLIQLASLLSDLIRAVLAALCILVIVKTLFNITAASFATSIGLVTAALALAAKDTVENIICSIIILLDKPFLLGDYITVSGVSGNVERIGLRRTVLRTDNKTLVSVPNRDLTGNKLENVSNQTFRRFRQEIRLIPGSQADQLEAFVKAIKDILKEQGNTITSNTVYLKNTGNQGHIIYMEYFVSISMTSADFYKLNEKINLSVISKMEQLQLQQVVLMADLNK
ncbi:MscS family membrane protein [Arachidicoccus rhizosphaerae]|uniref:MscS family membrane protein n=1 Tax=Arachidicoccus rhizosphaerae TaxID=551991 RepID=A0A1H3Y7U4_9BACT|nr:mechanosensitive ion channel domain-containing protein [Arachidicoccus rhizosphaerae]SEA07729.1 MscS family membrane protein [Arachidicoccus rhizosphaerae]